MIFYVLMFIQLILIGLSFFFWFQLNQEEGYETVPSTTRIKEKPIKRPQPEKATKKEKSPLSKKIGKSKQSPKIATDEEEISWEDFNIVERDKKSKEERKEMDETFGFGNKNNETSSFEDFNFIMDNKPKKRSLEEEFGDLFDEDEKNEINNGFEPTPSTIKKKEKEFDDFSDFDNFQLGDEEPKEEGIDNDNDAYDFLKNYDFKAEDKEKVDDSIFEKVRNSKKENSSDELNLDKKVDTFSTKKQDFPSKNNFDDANDDIFERLQRLSNMMDQQKK